jgi:HAD superfamily phosphoserine phosphatase-like hydrolase
MPKSIALFDIDNTIYDGFSYFELLQKQVDEDLISRHVLDNATGSMQRYKSKLQDYETTIVQLLDIYAAGLEGKRYDDTLKSTKEFYRNTDKFFPYIEPTIETLRVSHDISLVTGEPQFVAEAVAEIFGLGAYYSTGYGIQGGVFTGNVKSYLASRHEKHGAIKHLMQGHGTKNSFAFGDSEGDIEMLRAVEYPICLNPTAGLRSIAIKEGWRMPHISEVTVLVDKLVSMAA